MIVKREIINLKILVTPLKLMKERDLILHNFLTQCKDILPEYFKTLNKKTTSRQNIISIKKIIITLFKKIILSCFNNCKYDTRMISMSISLYYNPS